MALPYQLQVNVNLVLDKNDTYKNIVLTQSRTDWQDLSEDYVCFILLYPGPRNSLSMLHAS